MGELTCKNETNNKVIKEEIQAYVKHDTIFKYILFSIIYIYIFLIFKYPLDLKKHFTQR